MTTPINADESLRLYGLHPPTGNLGRIREILLAQSELEQDEQDLELMRLCCVQLFNTGQLDDILTIWSAKGSSFDASCSIDIQLLCGAGLDATKTYLAGDDSVDATDALQYLLECEAAGDFIDFSVADRSTMYARYYGR